MKPVVRALADIAGVPCPCGQARRIITAQDGSPASFHVVTIKADSAVHYHRRHTEIYHVLEGEGVIRLDGREHPLRAGATVLIPPGVRHRARGRLTIVNVVIPPFDPADEYIADAVPGTSARRKTRALSRSRPRPGPRCVRKRCR